MSPIFVRPVREQFEHDRLIRFLQTKYKRRAPVVSINVGDEITPLEIPVTTTLIVAGAIASRDYMPVHHDRDFANSQGSKDIFLNILTTNGLCVKFLHDWAGPEAMVKKLSIRLGVPAYPNDPLRFTGSVTAKSSKDGEGFVEIDNAWGRQGWTTANLEFLDREQFAAALKAAWQNSVDAAARRARSKRTPPG